MIKFVFINLLVLAFWNAFAEYRTPIPFFQDSKNFSKVQIKADFRPLLTFRGKRHLVVKPEDYAVDAEVLFDGYPPLKARLLPRGITRNIDCKDLPPFLLVFQKNDLIGTILEGANPKLKIVTHCLSYAGEDVRDYNSRSYQELVNEFFAYVTYERNTQGMGLKVKSMDVHYVDLSDGKIKEYDAYAFAIEHKKDFAKRIGAKVMEVDEGPCTPEEMRERETEVCNYTFNKLLIGDRQFKMFKKLQKNPASDRMKKWEFNFHLTAIDNSSDHPFGGNNSFVVLDKETGDYLVVPYDFNRPGFYYNSYIEWAFYSMSPIFKLSNEMEAQQFYNDILPDFQKLKTQYQAQVPQHDKFIYPWEFGQSARRLIAFGNELRLYPEFYFQRLRNPRPE